MTRYICKCGRIVHKSTNADNTGNRETDGCEGCPYLLPWGPMVWDDQHKAYTQDVKGHECRMSPTLEYTSTYHGRADDKCSLRIVSLDLDFLDEVQAWIYEHAADTLTAGFSRGSIRGIEFSDKGRYSLSVLCAQNKKGMAAKTALIEHFFGPDKHRLDMTPQQEKAHILAAIEDGKARGAEEEDSEAEGCDISICQCRSCGRESCFAHGCAKECPADADESCLTTSCPEYIERKDVTCCCETTSARTEVTAVTLAESAAPVQSPKAEISPASSQKNTIIASSCPSAEAAQSRNDSSDIVTNAPTSAPPSFDYSGLDKPTRDALHWAEREIGEARRDYIARLAQAVCIAHDALCGGVVQNLDNSKHGNRGDEAFVSWCASVGLKRSTAYNLLQVNALLSSSTPEEQEVLEAASPSLLYAAAKPSAPAELVQAVKDGDITTHKQYQDALAEIRKRDAKIQELLEMSEDAARRADEARAWAKKVEHDADLASKREEEARAAAHKYHVQVEEVEAQRNALLDQQTEYIDRIHELESRPVEVDVQEPTEEQIAAAAKQRTAMLEAQVRSLQADKDSALRQLDELGNTAYMAAAEFADNAARTVDSIRTAFWALAKELSGDDFAEALAPLDEAVRKIYEREWDDEESET